MNKLVRATLISTCLVAFASSAAVVAQTTSNPNTPPRASAPAQKPEKRPFSSPTERVEARLAYIKTALKIGDRQQSQWDAYANFMRKSAQEMEQRFTSMRTERTGHPRGKRPSAIERLERQQSFHAEAITRLNRVLEVEKPLYAALSPDQQKIADQVLNPRFGPMRGGSMRGRPMPGPERFGRG